MGKKSLRTYTELKPEDLTDISQEMKDEFLATGLKPYLSNEGKIYWLNDDQLSYKMVKSMHSKKLNLFPKKKGSKLRRRHRHSLFYKYVLKHWVIYLFLILLFFMIAFFRELVALF